MTLAALSLVYALLGQTPAAIMAEAWGHYEAGRIKEALPMFDGLAKRDDLTAEQRGDALRYQAFSLYLLDLYPEAKQAWLRLLTVAPETRLDPDWVSPELYAFFSHIEPNANAALTAPVPEPARGCGVVLCAIPLGTGQFANGSVVKGAVFAGLEVGLLGTYIGLYASRQNDDVLHPNQTLLALEWTSLGLFVASVGLGIVDAYMSP